MLPSKWYRHVLLIFIDYRILSLSLMSLISYHRLPDNTNFLSSSSMAHPAFDHSPGKYFSLSFGITLFDWISKLSPGNMAVILYGPLYFNANFSSLGFCRWISIKSPTEISNEWHGFSLNFCFCKAAFLHNRSYESLQSLQKPVPCELSGEVLIRFCS